MSRGLDRALLPVGVFDSGVGGISVLREMVKLLPKEDFLFFGDSANAPYGTKTPEQVRKLTMRQVRKLREQGVKAVVIACNTATSAAIGTLREAFADMPVIGIEPALKPAVALGKAPVVVVMATPATVNGDKFHHLTEQYQGEASIYPVACPGLMEFVEQGIFEGPEVEDTLRRLLSPCLEKDPDALVLGCTHYPFLRRAIRKVAGDKPVILDGSIGTAYQLRARLQKNGLLAERSRPGKVCFQMSLPGKEALCRRLLEG